MAVVSYLSAINCILPAWESTMETFLLILLN